MCHAIDQVLVTGFSPRAFRFTPSEVDVVFVVDEAAVQQVFPMEVITLPLFRTPCHQGLVQ
jgi:hypothetical protein